MQQFILSGGTWHACVIQLCDSSVGGQACPPFWDAVITDLLRICLPPPQVALHVPQLPQSLTTQFTGSGSTGRIVIARHSHPFLASSSGQDLPPFLGYVKILLLFLLIPYGFSALHPSHSPLSPQSLTTQSIGLGGDVVWVGDVVGTIVFGIGLDEVLVVDLFIFQDYIFYKHKLDQL